MHSTPPRTHLHGSGSGGLLNKSLLKWVGMKIFEASLESVGVESEA